MLTSTALPFLLLFVRESILAVHLKTKQGILDGELSESRDGKPYHSFYNIPFAKPPLGELRFEPPKDADSWEGVRDAQTPSDPCIQSMKWIFPLSEQNMIMGAEDCLYLNVYTPNVKPSSLLPVMVYFHGGAFAVGSTSIYGPEYLMDYPIVVVTTQFRLNVLGFLSAVDETLPGNYGLKDQTAALRWVQRNIETFGGDPKRVTIAGSSAGAVSAHLHQHSPLSAGLFHGAISQSGTALAVWANTNSQMAKERARALGVMMGCRDLETKALVKCLRQVPVEQLISGHDKLYVYDLTPIIPFGPVVEPRSVKDAFLIQSPWKQNVINGVPWMVGINKDEGNVVAERVYSKPHVLEEWNRDYGRLLSIAFDYSDKENTSAISTAIKKFYFKDNDISLKYMRNFSELFNDGYFLVDTLEAAKRHNSKVFFYWYQHRNNPRIQGLYGNVTYDVEAGHVDEVISLFQLNGFLPPINEGDADYVVSKRMCNYWANFVEKGDPNGKEKIWQPFAPQTLDYLHIGSKADVMEKNLLLDRYLFWKNLLYSSADHQVVPGKGS